MGFPERFLGSLLSLTVVLLSFLSSIQGRRFSIGGKDGWVIHPHEMYNHWAERNRFQVNDTLFFKYKKGSNSVLLVSREDYFPCNTKNPIQSMTEGDSVFTFDHSGPFFFISGQADNCNNGQKLIVVVMALRHTRPLQHSPSPSPLLPPKPPTSTNPPAEAPSVLDAPAPAPAPSDRKSGSPGLVSVTWLVLGLGIGVSMAMGSF